MSPACQKAGASRCEATMREAAAVVFCFFLILLLTGMAANVLVWLLGMGRAWFVWLVLVVLVFAALGAPDDA